MSEQTNINKKDIVKILKSYNLEHPVSVKKINTSGNLAFFIISGKNKYFLRLCGDGLRHRSRREIEGELDLIDQLRKKGLPVPGYIKTATGGKVVGVKNHYGYLREYIIGRQISRDPTSKQLFIVGKILGEMHRKVKDYNTGGFRKNINFGLEKTKKYFSREKNNILRSGFARSPEFVRVWQEEIDKIELPSNLAKGMIHEDLGRRHVLWQNGKVKAVIDFDRSYYGYLLLDLGQALRGWCFADSWRRWSGDNCRRFLAGYEAEKKLLVREREHLSSVVKFAILERALAYCTKFVYSTRPEKRDEKFAQDSLFRQIKLIKI